MNYLYEKMKLQENLHIFGKRLWWYWSGINLIFVRKMTSKTRRCCNSDTWLENQHQKHDNIVRTLIFDWNVDVVNLKVVTTSWPKIRTQHLDIFSGNLFWHRHRLLDIFSRHLWVHLKLFSVELSCRHLIYVLSR